MKTANLLAGLALLSATCFAQLTPEQKSLDFQHLAGLYAKQYAPYEWKLGTYGFDLLNLAPWLRRIGDSKTDLEFYEISQEYVNSLRDAHATYYLPSDFAAFLGFTVDSYDGRYLIDAIDTSRIAKGTLPSELAIGDELVWLDDRGPGDWVRAFSGFRPVPNPLTVRREAALFVTYRLQQYLPRAHEIADNAVIWVRHRSGQYHVHVVPWEKTGRLLVSAGISPTPKYSGQVAAASPGEEEGTPPYMQVLRPLRTWRMLSPRQALTTGGARPVFSLPPGFVQRLGRAQSDFFFSGTYASEGVRIGFVRIPGFEPLSRFQALAQFSSEMTFLQANTDTLVVDIMGNPGGDGCYTQDLLQLLIPYRFQMIGGEIRPTRELLIAFRAAIDIARLSRAPNYEIAILEAVFGDIEGSYRENRGRTGSVSLCSVTPDIDPLLDRNGNPSAYSKPLLVLTDELSGSAADAFAAVIQDARRGRTFGMRTVGAGGSVKGPFYTGFYSGGFASVTGSLLVRTVPVTSKDFPVSQYIENIGVRPDIEIDYMTEENLLKRGRPFVDAFTRSVVESLRGAGR